MQENITARWAANQRRIVVSELLRKVNANSEMADMPLQAAEPCCTFESAIPVMATPALAAAGGVGAAAVGAGLAAGAEVEEAADD
jgi:hypothetical protein